MNTLDSYIETALWSSTDENGEPLDSSKYADAVIAPETRAKMQADLDAFFARIDAEKLHYGKDDATFAHDFWLTRNRHGAGFWDGDYSKVQVAQELEVSRHTLWRALLRDEGI